MGPEYQELLSRLPSLLLVAVHPTSASARTLGNACMLMFQSDVDWNGNIERSLNGPPSDKWADPWVAHISTKAEMLLGYELAGFDFDPPAQELKAHYTNRISGALAGWHTRADCLLDERAPVFSRPPFGARKWSRRIEDSAWAITSVSQRQFWKYSLQFGDYGDGGFQEVLPVIISGWDTPGTEVVKKSASQCSPSELFEETLAQMNAALGHELSESAIPREAILDWFLDPDIQFPFDAPQERGPEQAAVTEGLNRSRLHTAQQFSEQYAHNAESRPCLI